jgi:Cu(I)/Ag(I) efflux system protein CusF
MMQFYLIHFERRSFAMKLIPTVSLMLAMIVSSAAFAQSGGMNMDMNKDKGMASKGGMEHGKPMQGQAAKAHEATGVVKALDTEKGTVTLAHGPVKSLNWPAMTMSFAVKDKALFNKLAVDKKVHIQFVQQGSDYVVTSVK